ncbi:17037_t:CDS:1, partial [Cetraspora pellucida]
QETDKKRKQADWVYKKIISAEHLDMPLGSLSEHLGGLLRKGISSIPKPINILGYIATLACFLQRPGSELVSLLQPWRRRLNLLSCFFGSVR